VVDLLEATKVTLAETVGVVMWAVQVALGGTGMTQTVVSALGLLGLINTGKAKLTCNVTELPLTCSSPWSSG
jgi:hypothetical protein